MEINFFNDNDKSWNKFLIENNGNFLQSFEWGKFQRDFSKKIFRIEIKEKQKILLRAQVIQKKISFKTYLYIPYGPVFNKNVSSEQKHKIFDFFLIKIQNLLQKEKPVFLRIEPLNNLPSQSKFHFQKLLKRIQPQKTLILDLEKTKDEIFNDFNKKTRYNIRLAQKKEVKIKILSDYSDAFYRLMEKTKKRQGFRSHSEIYYKKILRIDSKDFKTNLFLAEYKNNIITASIIFFFGKRAVSLHMASDYNYRALKAPDFLHWKKILFAKEKGYKEYDFWGIDEKKWPGITYFKKGFGGKEIEYGQAQDIIFQNYSYKIYSILRKLK